MDDDDEYGAGSIGAGAGPAGWDHDPELTAKPLVSRVPAPKFDPLTRRYPMSSSGALEGEHPVMARARHLLGIRRRGLTSAAQSGIPIGGMRVATKGRRQREAEDAVNQALKPLLEAGDVLIERVVLSSPYDGTFYTDLRNLRAPDEKNEPTRITSSLQD